MPHAPLVLLTVTTQSSPLGLPPCLSHQSQNSMSAVGRQVVVPTTNDSPDEHSHAPVSAEYVCPPVQEVAPFWVQKICVALAEEGRDLWGPRICRILWRDCRASSSRRPRPAGLAPPPARRAFGLG